VAAPGHGEVSEKSSAALLTHLGKRFRAGATICEYEAKIGLNFNVYIFDQPNNHPANRSLAVPARVYTSPSPRCLLVVLKSIIDSGATTVFNERSLLSIIVPSMGSLYVPSPTNTVVRAMDLSFLYLF
jgi:hypothetical protein